MKPVSFLGLGALFLSVSFVPPEKGLKDYYKDYFPIGAAVAPRNLTGPEADLIR